MKCLRDLSPIFRHALLLLVCLWAVGCSRIERPLQVDSHYSVEDPQFVRTMGNLLGPPLRDGNSIKPLINGDEIFPAMLQAIRSAQKTISFETFIYWRGHIARDFADALSERARVGVKIHVIIDAVGGFRMEKKLIREMRAAGVDVRLYHPLQSWNVLKLRRFNNRTHRKILVVDGRVGFTGGVGIGDEWTGHAQDSKHWRDNHFRIEGPVVSHLQAAFVDNWIETGGRVLNGEDYFPFLEKRGDVLAQVFMSSSDDASSSMELMYLLSIASARKSIFLGMAYFIPDKETIAQLLKARQRGVDVQIIVPGPILDYKIVRRASREKWGPLLKAGVKIYEYQPTLYHSKIMIVDDIWVSIGSANFDNRSFRLNDEANLNAIDRNLAARMRKVLENDKDHSIRCDYEKWRNRGAFHKANGQFSLLFAPQL